MNEYEQELFNEDGERLVLFKRHGSPPMSQEEKITYLRVLADQLEELLPAKPIDQI